MLQKSTSALVQSIAGIVFLLVGLAVFAIRLKHEGPYIMPVGGALYSGIGLLVLGALLQWRACPVRWDGLRWQ